MVDRIVDWTRQLMIMKIWYVLFLNLIFSDQTSYVNEFKISGLPHLHHTSLQLVTLFSWCTKDKFYSMPDRPPELCVEKADVTVAVTERCDAWAVGVCLLEASKGKRFFDGVTPVEILKQINSYVVESGTKISGTMLCSLKEAMSLMPVEIRSPVGHLLKAVPKNRMPCSKFIKESAIQAIHWMAALQPFWQRKVGQCQTWDMCAQQLQIAGELKNKFEILQQGLRKPFMPEPNVYLKVIWIWLCFSCFY